MLLYTVLNGATSTIICHLQNKSRGHYDRRLSEPEILLSIAEDALDGRMSWSRKT